MKSARAFRWNVSWAFVGQATPLVAALVSMPVLVRCLGPDRVGLLSIVLVALGYFSVLDFGLSKAVTKFTAELLHRNEQERVAVVFWSAVRFQVLMGVAGGVVLASVTPFLVYHALNVPPALHSEGIWSLLISSASLPLIFVATSLTGLLQAAHRFDLPTKVQAPAGAINYLLPAAMAMSYPNLPLVVVILVGSRVISTLILYRCTVRLFPGLSRVTRMDRETFKSLFRFGGWMTVSNIVGTILVYLDRFIIGSMLSVAQVAYYSVPSDMVSRLLILPSSLTTVLFPAFSAETQGRGRLLRRSALVALAALGVPALLIVIFGDVLMKLWMGADFATHSGLPLRILAVGVLANGLAYIPASFVQASGRPDLTARLSLVEMPFQIVLIWVGISLYGIAGAAAAWSLRTILDGIALYFFAWRILRAQQRTAPQPAPPGAADMFSPHETYGEIHG